MKFPWIRLANAHPGFKQGEIHLMVGTASKRAIGAQWGREMKPMREIHRDEDDKLAKRFWNLLFPTSSLDRPTEDFQQILVRTLAEEIRNEIDNEIINNLTSSLRTSKASRSRR